VTAAPGFARASGCADAGSCGALSQAQEMAGVAMETAHEAVDELMVKAQEAREAVQSVRRTQPPPFPKACMPGLLRHGPVCDAMQVAAEALSSAEESVNQAIFDAEELWKRMPVGRAWACRKWQGNKYAARALRCRRVPLAGRAAVGVPGDARGQGQLPCRRGQEV
jgi:hypothetical protein